MELHGGRTCFVLDLAMPSFHNSVLGKCLGKEWIISLIPCLLVGGRKQILLFGPESPVFPPSPARACVSRAQPASLF